MRVVPERGREGMQPIVNDLNMEIGYGYRSAAIISEPGNEAPLHGDPHRSKGMPGTRAPHVTLEHAGKPISTFDLFTRNFCILAAPGGGAWCEAARTAAAELGLALDAHRLDNGELRDSQRRFVEAYGLSPSGAVLVRPDGFVGWRAVDASGASTATMRRVLASLLCRNAT
jgi:putative polyketide hydroxylase